MRWSPSQQFSRQHARLPEDRAGTIDVTQSSIVWLEYGKIPLKYGNVFTGINENWHAFAWRQPGGWLAGWLAEIFLMSRRHQQACRCVGRIWMLPTSLAANDRSPAMQTPQKYRSVEESNGGNNGTAGPPRSRPE